MRYSHIAPKYARALLNVAIELGKQEEYGQLLAFVVELYDKTKQFLDDPTQNSAKQVERIVGFLNQVGVAVDKPFWSFFENSVRKEKAGVFTGDFGILHEYENRIADESTCCFDHCL